MPPDVQTSEAFVGTGRVPAIHFRKSFEQGLSGLLGVRNVEYRKAGARKQRRPFRVSYFAAACASDAA